MDERVVALVDMDCFYVQVAQREAPHTKSLPCAVLHSSGSTLLACNYIARHLGVRKITSVREALRICPELVLLKVAEKRGRVDLSAFRSASNEVMSVLSQFTSHFEKASVDEAFIDLTELVNQELGTIDPTTLFDQITTNSVIYGGTDVEDQLRESCHSVKLALGAVIIDHIRRSIFEQTGLTCSAGIAKNKTLAKLVSNLNKPNKQTLLLENHVHNLLSSTDIRDVRHFGGKLGEDLKYTFGVAKIGELTHVPLSTLTNRYGQKLGERVFRMCRGVCDESVKLRHAPMSLGCSQRLNDRITKTYQIKETIEIFASELYERFQEDFLSFSRYPTCLVVGLTTRRGEQHSKVVNLPKPINQNTLSECNISKLALETLTKFNMSTDHFTWQPSVSLVSISLGKFLSLHKASDVHNNNNNYSIGKFFVHPKPTETLNKSTLEDNPNANTAEGVVSLIESEAALKCTDCGRMIQLNKLVEHEDYHFALNLQKKLQKRETPSVNIKNYFR